MFLSVLNFDRSIELHSKGWLFDGVVLFSVDAFHSLLFSTSWKLLSREQTLDAPEQRLMEQQSCIH